VKLVVQELTIAAPAEVVYRLLTESAAEENPPFT
jgi:uncharacterized protein YndB with AHSA1/START domain